jgi:hypothetical protein
MATHRILLKDIINRTLKCVGDYFGSGYIAGRTWTRAQVIIAINQALLEWSRKTGFLRKVDTVSLTDGTKTYDWPDDLIIPVRIGFYDDNACTWVGRPTSITDQDLAYLTITGEAFPLYYFLEHLAYSKFGFQPTVGESTTAYINYIRAPTYLDNEDNYPEDAIPTWFHKDIKWGAAIKLLEELKENDGRRAKLPYCQMKWKKKLDFMKSLKAFHGHDHGVFPV